GRPASHARPNATRNSLRPAHRASVPSRLTPGAPLTSTSGSLGSATTCDVGIGIGSEHDIAVSPMRTAPAPRNAILSAPIGNVLSPSGGVTYAVPGGIGTWRRVRLLKPVVLVVVAKNPLMNTGPGGADGRWPCITSASSPSIEVTSSLTGLPT